MGKTVVEAKSDKIRLVVRSQDSATIYRPGMPYIIDRTEKTVEWLAAKGYTPEDIVLEGEKPANWDAVFSPPSPETKEEVAPSENVAPV